MPKQQKKSSSAGISEKDIVAVLHVLESIYVSLHQIGRNQMEEGPDYASIALKIYFSDAQFNRKIGHARKIVSELVDRMFPHLATDEACEAFVKKARYWRDVSKLPKNAATLRALKKK